jgi:hypothetical protein
MAGLGDRIAGATASQGLGLHEKSEEELERISQVCSPAAECGGVGRISGLTATAVELRAAKSPAAWASKGSGERRTR